MNKNEIKKAFQYAYPHTLPILAGFLFIGTAYGIYMNSEGFSPLYPAFMSASIFAGSMEFVTASLLQHAFNPLYAYFITLIVNSRHLFYGISMLKKYNHTGRKKFYLIFGMCDETFSINCTAQIPETISKEWFFFFVTLLDHLYWIIGAAVGGLLGSMIRFNTNGIEFVMNALFLVIFIEQWQRDTIHLNACLGLLIPSFCLFLFGAEYFMIPSMIGILASLSFLRRILEKRSPKIVHT